MSKPFFYRINAADFFSVINSIKSDRERGRFVYQFAVDLVTQSGTSSYAKSVISEALKYIEKKREAGSKGGKQKASSAKAVLGQCHDFANSKTLASSSSSNSNKKDLKDLSGGRVFNPPSIEEVKAYCLERGNRVDPEKWLNHYASNGWMVGKNKMKDWRAAVRTWESNQFSNGKATTLPFDPPKTKQPYC